MDQPCASGRNKKFELRVVYMAKLTIVLGMAGSGKTHFCKQLSQESGAKFFNDATLVDDKRRSGHGCLSEIVARLLGRSEDCIMDESHLTVSSFRSRFKSFCDEYLEGIELQWICFEADVLACINNVFYDFTNQIRSKPGRLNALNRQRTQYELPSETELPDRLVQTVYRQAEPEFKHEDTAIKWLESEIERMNGVS